jgi:hypothetical protein
MTGSPLEYAGKFEAKRKLASNKEFFEQKFFTENASFSTLLSEMRQKLSRNCILLEQAEERCKNKILPVDAAQ